jgi:uroporphyrinogen decarboxylase
MVLTLTPIDVAGGPQVKAMHTMDPMATCPFVHETLQNLKREIGNQATLLGFVGLPYTLATYLVEGQSSKVRG